MTAASPSVWNRLAGTSVPLLTFPRLVLAYTFISMGIHKIDDPVAFLKLLRLYQMLPEEPAVYMNSVAVVMPWLEVVFGVALLFRVPTRAAAVALLAMVVAFSAAIFLRAMDIYAEGATPFTEIVFDCGCGGGPQVIYQKLLKNTGLMALGLVAVLSRPRPLWVRTDQ